MVKLAELLGDSYRYADFELEKNYFSLVKKYILKVWEETKIVW